MALGGVLTYALTNGSTTTINVDSNLLLPDVINIYSGTGGNINVTLTISFATTPVAGSHLRIYFDGKRISPTSPGSITIFGNTLSPIGSNVIIDVFVDATGSLTYNQTIPAQGGMPQSGGYFTNTIEGGNIMANTILPTSLLNGTSAQILLANGAGVFNQVSVTGPVTISNLGVTSIVPITDGMLAPAANNSAKVTNNSGVVTDIVLNNGQYLGNVGYGIQACSINPSGQACCVQTAHIILNNAQILALNGTPQVVIPSPGPGYYIQILGAFGRITEPVSGSPYTTNTSLILYTTSATHFLWAEPSNLLAATSTNTYQFGFGYDAGGNLNGSNSALYISTQTGNPGGGAVGNLLDLYVTYLIVAQ